MNPKNSRYHFADLVKLMQRLRSPEGCPWDREQTPESLQPYLLEETYEVLESLDRGVPEEICEELGDLLLQVVFHAQIFAERNLFTIEDVIHGITAKLIRRHPHVFEGTGFDSLEELHIQWEQIKKEEKSNNSSREHVAGRSLTARTPLPALMLAKKLLERRNIAVDSSSTQQLEKLLFPQGEAGKDAIEERIGEAICSLAVLGNQRGVDAEQALRRYLARRSPEMPKKHDEERG